MEDRYMESRSGMPGRHYIFALLFAAVAGCGVWAWLNQKAMESASAVLAFSPMLAQQAAPNLASAQKPAIALAESILNDQTIAGLAKQSQATPSTDANQIGEFRSGLELKQPTASVLMVRFVDSDPGDAAANANAVAQALAAWSPETGASASATGPQTLTPAAAPAPSKTAAPPSQENKPASAATPPHHALSDGLGEISAQLSTTDADMDRLAAQANTGRSPSSNPQSAYAKYRQQQLLRTQVNAAQKKLSDLRAHSDEGAANREVKRGLASVQEALGSILQSGEPGARGFRAAGTSASQLSRERSQLTRAISVIHQAREEIGRVETAHSASDGSSQGPSPSASSTPKVAQASPSIEPAPQAADAETSTPLQPSEHPLSIVRLARPTPPPPLWPPIVACLAGGLLYLGSAAWAYRRAAHEEDYDEVRAYPQRFITPDEPAYTHVEHIDAADLAAAPTDTAMADTTVREREPTAFFAAPKESGDAPRRAAFLWDEPAEATVATREEPRIGKSKSAVREKLVQEDLKEDDPIADQIRKSLSETEIGKMFEGANQGAAGVASTENTHNAGRR